MLERVEGQTYERDVLRCSEIAIDKSEWRGSSQVPSLFACTFLVLYIGSIAHTETGITYATLSEK